MTCNKIIHASQKTIQFFFFFLENQKTIQLEKYYIYNILQQILSGNLLLVVMGGQKNNLRSKLKFKLITIYHM